MIEHGFQMTVEHRTKCYKASYSNG